jgi:hypothetical protein
MPVREGERFERLAEALARMWVEHPESLASPIRVLEHSRDNEPRRGGSSRVGFFHVGAGPYPALFPLLFPLQRGSFLGGTEAPKCLCM